MPVFLSIEISIGVKIYSIFLPHLNSFRVYFIHTNYMYQTFAITLSMLNTSYLYIPSSISFFFFDFSPLFSPSLKTHRLSSYTYPLLSISLSPFLNSLLRTSQQGTALFFLWHSPFNLPLLLYLSAFD